MAKTANIISAWLDYKMRVMRLVTLTPEIATGLLERNTRNRPLSDATVARYKKDMQDGRWRSTAQPIVLDWSGDLLDGQHRLWAVVESGISVECYLATGEDPDTFPAYDRGRGRTAADALAIDEQPNYTLLAAAAGRVCRHERGTAWSTTAADRYVNVEEVMETVDRHPDLMDSIRAVQNKKVAGVGRLAPPSLAAFLHYLFAQRDRELADWFFDALHSGAGLKKSDAVLHLRNRLTANKLQKAKLPEKEVGALIIKAWNAHRNGKKVKTLRWRNTGDKPEAFPEID